MQSTVFIYLKDDNIKVLDIEESKLKHDSLVSDNWKHIVTLNSAVYLNMLLNLESEKDVIREVKCLKTIHFLIIASNQTD